MSYSAYLSPNGNITCISPICEQCYRFHNYPLVVRWWVADPPASVAIPKDQSHV